MNPEEAQTLEEGTAVMVRWEAGDPPEGPYLVAHLPVEDGFDRTEACLFSEDEVPEDHGDFPCRPVREAWEITLL